MTDAVSGLVRHEQQLPDERWPDQDRGGATWRTLFTGELTPSSALTTGTCTLPVGEQLAPHRHETVESYYVLEGSGLLVLGDSEHEIGAGSAVHIPSLVTHGVHNTGEAALRFFYVFAADSFASVEYHFD